MLYTVYGLHEEGKPDDVEYIGLTNQKPSKRLAQHLSDSSNSGTPVNMWVRGLINRDTTAQCRVLAQTEDVDFAVLLEKQLIADFVHGGFVLHNVQGGSRRKATREERAARLKYLQSLKGVRAARLSNTLEQATLRLQAEIESGRLNVQSFLSGQN